VAACSGISADADAVAKRLDAAGSLTAPFRNAAGMLSVPAFTWLLLVVFVFCMVVFVFFSFAVFCR
jgi:hypothetical protein